MYLPASLRIMFSFSSVRHSLSHRGHPHSRASNSRHTTPLRARLLLSVARINSCQRLDNTRRTRIQRTSQRSRERPTLTLRLSITRSLRRCTDNLEGWEWANELRLPLLPLKLFEGC